MIKPLIGVCSSRSNIYSLHRSATSKMCDSQWIVSRICNDAPSDSLGTFII